MMVSCKLLTLTCKHGISCLVSLWPVDMSGAAVRSALGGD